MGTEKPRAFTQIQYALVFFWVYKTPLFYSGVYCCLVIPKMCGKCKFVQLVDGRAAAFILTA